MSIKMKTLGKIILAVSAFLLVCYIEGKYNLVFKEPVKATMAGRKILAADFEVFGIVQGVFFRVHTEKAAKELGVRGWCMNTKEGTVKGQMEAEEGPFNQMKEWLSKTGSPQSRIDKAVFSEPKILSDYTFESFDIRRVRK